MARKDVVKYYINVQNQYIEMVNDVKDFDEALKEGKVEQWQFDNAQNMLARIKENYERLTYIVFLLNAPNRKDKKQKYFKNNSNLIKVLSTSGEEYVIKENDDVLKEFKKLVAEVKKNG